MGNTTGKKHTSKTEVGGAGTEAANGRRKGHMESSGGGAVRKPLMMDE